MRTIIEKKLTLVIGASGSTLAVRPVLSACILRLICALYLSLRSAERTKSADSLPDVADDVNFGGYVADGKLGSLEALAVLLEQFHAVIQGLDLPVCLCNITLTC